ncbi:MAG TPA: hypothetical protein VK970_09860 [Candidatus Methylacidiphilales bacterium]|nr:hypothetical protein [Candidatus Methylacidiphilales bacterium]
MNTIESLEDDFLHGDLTLLAMRACPRCGEVGTILFSVCKSPATPDAVAGRRYKAGISIYCKGPCDYMLSHLAGFCPAWAEEVNDWAAFSQELAQGRSPRIE